MKKTEDSFKSREEISARKTQEKLTKLIEDLEDENAEFRWNVVVELGAIIDVRAAEALTQRLLDEDCEIRDKAADLLWKMREIAVEPLIKALKNKSWKIRDKAAEILGEIGDARAIEPLIQALEDTMKDEDVDYGLDIWEVPTAKALTEIGEPAVEPLIKALKDRGTIYWVVEKILIDIGEPTVEHLIKALKDEDWSVRRSLARILGTIGDKRAVNPLIRALRDNHEDVRQEAAWALGELDDESAIRSLVHALDDDSI
ncbi:MAG: HEAT repeat domain-containing protein, partial [Asgard group archaeon]